MFSRSRRKIDRFRPSRPNFGGFPMCLTETNVLDRARHSKISFDRALPKLCMFRELFKFKHYRLCFSGIILRCFYQIEMIRVNCILNALWGQIFLSFFPYFDILVCNLFRKC